MFHFPSHFKSNKELVPLLLFVGSGVTMSFSFFAKKVFYDKDWKFDKDRRSRILPKMKN